MYTYTRSLQSSSASTSLSFLGINFGRIFCSLGFGKRRRAEVLVALAWPTENMSHMSNMQYMTANIMSTYLSKMRSARVKPR